MTETDTVVHSTRKAWLLRSIYILVSVGVFIFMPFFLIWLGYATGVTWWKETFGPYVFFDTTTGPAFVIGFVSVLFMVALMIFFIMKAFDTTEGAW
ncbi:MAG: hypothetical protein HXY34_10005 [Candidatus Thorarchaeota archaeon]|nr:hypothetical protein [Candidatus Thorarchaeota archaeon]